MKVLIHEWVTGGGLAGSTMLPESLAAEGHAMRRAVVADFRGTGAEVVSTLDERFAGTEPGGPFVAVAALEEWPAIARLTRQSDYTVVIAPETGGTLRDLAHLVNECGGTWLGSDPDAIDLCTDKLRLSRHWDALGVPNPRTVPVDASSDFPHGLAFPVVGKPIEGAGCAGTYYSDGPGLTFPDVGMIVQPYIRGQPLSATFLIGPTGAITLVGVGWQSVKIHEKRFSYHGGRIPAPIEYGLGPPLAAVRSVDGLRGYVGVDFIRDPETGLVTVLEINPRVTTSYVGLTSLLPAGTIARAWIDSFSNPQTGDDLRGMVAPGRGRSVVFSVSGEMTFEDSGGVDDIDQ